MKTNLKYGGIPAVEAVKKAVEIDQDWDVAENEEKLHFYILRAAQNVDRFEPFTKEELELNTYLASRMSGKRLCDYAWRLLAQST